MLPSNTAYSYMSGEVRDLVRNWCPFFVSASGPTKNSLVPFFLVPRSTYSGRQLLVGYWGQNGAGPANGPANYEKPLAEVCRTTKYDILAVSFVIVFFDQRQKGNDIHKF